MQRDIRKVGRRGIGESVLELTVSSEPPPVAAAEVHDCLEQVAGCSLRVAQTPQFSPDARERLLTDVLGRIPVAREKEARRIAPAERAEYRSAKRFSSGGFVRNALRAPATSTDILTPYTRGRR